MTGYLLLAEFPGDDVPIASFSTEKCAVQESQTLTLDDIVSVAVEVFDLPDYLRPSALRLVEFFDGTPIHSRKVRTFD